jgi:hypothetical protein
MTAIVYPASLPRMQLWPTVPRERRAMSGGEGIKAAPRARSRDRIADIDAQWFYKPAHMAVWAPWYEDDLLNGTRWFAINAPGPGGWMQRVCRYRTGTVRREALPGGHWRVSAQLEQRGRGVDPSVAEFPEIVDTATTLSPGASTSHMVAVPAVESGDLLLMAVVPDIAATVTTPSGWTLLGTAADGGGAVRLSLFSQVAASASAASSVAVSLGASVAVSAFVHRVVRHALTPHLEMTSGSGAAADPPSASPPWGVRNTLWIACCGINHDVSVTGLPTGYSDDISSGVSGAGTNGTTFSTCARPLRAATENPSAFSFEDPFEPPGSGNWVAAVVAVAGTA